MEGDCEREKDEATESGGVGLAVGGLRQQPSANPSGAPPVGASIPRGITGGTASGRKTANEVPYQDFPRSFLCSFPHQGTPCRGHCRLPGPCARRGSPRCLRGFCTPGGHPSIGVANIVISGNKPAVTDRAPGRGFGHNRHSKSQSGTTAGQMHSRTPPPPCKSYAKIPN